ncbi:DUF6461 domain-containing protein [Actinokineospora sp. PR83]|uniref:DUF6461 domain-containing protein n=1 Tax=Actinokineospora sp. PR83 TaxID=2884908 RepID=UPI0027DF2D9D|nr:DUF6461 domain-containing protein [Actinokineospora sp. PR83]MCG8916909.1 DUF6461 domain-containing protein [Actinokineospora sp. PR83]
MLGVDQVRRYGWADEDADLAWTVAVTTGRSVDDVISAYGGDVGQEPVLLPFAQAHVSPDELGARSLVQVREVSGHVVTIENNGWVGKRPAVAEHASEGGGRFISVFWNLNANHTVVQAVDGKLVACFDPLTVQHPAPVGETYPDWITDVVFTGESLHAILLAIVERQTGVAFDPAWLTDPSWTYRVPA